MTRSPVPIAATVPLHSDSEGPLNSAHAGAPLVFLHALGCDLRLWEAVTPAFISHHRVIRCDLRGHGSSACGRAECIIEDHVNDVIALLDRKGITEATLLGISIGGMIALAAALRYPDRVRRIVACATAARIGTRDSWNERIAAVTTRGLDGVADIIIRRWFTPRFLESDPAIVAEHRRRLLRTPTAGYLASCVALREADYRDRVTGIRIPTLVIPGENDVAVPMVQARELADAIPGARWSPIADCGHLPSVEKPAATTEAIARFLTATA